MPCFAENCFANLTDDQKAVLYSTINVLIVVVLEQCLTPNGLIFLYLVLSVKRNGHYSE